LESRDRLQAHYSIFVLRDPLLAKPCLPGFMLAQWDALAAGNTCRCA